MKSSLANCPAMPSWSIMEISLCEPLLTHQEAQDSSVVGERISFRDGDRHDLVDPFLSERQIPGPVDHRSVRPLNHLVIYLERGSRYLLLECKYCVSDSAILKSVLMAKAMLTALSSPKM